MLRSLFYDRKVLVLALIALLIRLCTLSPKLVEQAYSRGVYSPLSRGMRLLLGWLPFSFGDLLYAVTVIWLLWKLGRWVRHWRAGQSRRILLAYLVRQTLLALLVVYVTFQLLWGLNYSRQGIAKQMELDVQPYTTADLSKLADQLQFRLAETSLLVDTTGREHFGANAFVKKVGVAAYHTATQHYPFLTYQAPSVKPSLYSALGHLIGFTGYYNPFTAEAQIKTSIPQFLKPFVVTHEIAHQLGYAKESEANFVAFLASHRSVNGDVRYAVYFELFLYTTADIRRRDSVQARKYREAAPLQVQRDMHILADYLERSRNPVEPYMAQFYDAYLRMNNQPKGRETYNEVVAWLVAYGKKYGLQAI